MASAYCSESPTGQHEPVDVEVLSQDTHSLELGFSCYHCGVQGTFTLKYKACDWEEVEESEEDLWDADEDDEDDEYWE